MGLRVQLFRVQRFSALRNTYLSHDHDTVTRTSQSTNYDTIPVSRNIMGLARFADAIQTPLAGSFPHFPLNTIRGSCPTNGVWGFQILAPFLEEPEHNMGQLSNKWGLGVPELGPLSWRNHNITWSSISYWSQPKPCSHPQRRASSTCVKPKSFGYSAASRQTPKPRRPKGPVENTVPLK